MMIDSKEFLKLHPDNPRYFSYRGKPQIFITAAEHYGAVINLDFDYVAYLDMLKEKGFKLTRIFIFYREQPGSCSGLEAKGDLYFSELGRQNTLAPAHEKSYLAPWVRSDEPGCFDGGNKFDLTKWNEAYFVRLKDFCQKAEERGIIVEVTLFSQYYSDSDSSPWKVSPLNIINNINGIGDIRYTEFVKMANKDVLAVQEALVKRIVAELKDFGNIYYEICNEPNPMPDESNQDELKRIAEWQNHLVSLISNLEAEFPDRHMIAVCDPNEHYNLDHVSVLNFHYEMWASNGLKTFYNSNRPLAFDETLTGILAWNRPMDFEGRRKEAWEFILKGFGVYNYLDLTIATEDPTGSGKALFPYGQYYNGETMRRYLKHLNDFINSFEFTKMQPDPSVIKGDYLTASIHALVEHGKAYAVYINGSALKFITIELPEGLYTVQWFNPRTGQIDAVQYGIQGGGDILLEVPLYEQDIAIRIMADGGK